MQPDAPAPPAPAHRRSFRRRHLALPVLTLMVVAVALLPAWHRPGSPNRPLRTEPPLPLMGPRAVYLALGDSLGYGYQPNFNITSGYADALFERLKTYGVQQLVNLACPGETTTSMLSGGCRLRSLAKQRYSGPQIDEAEALIAAHPGQVSPVTLTVGANDVLDDLGPRCAERTAAFEAHLDMAARNLDAILARLSTALAGQGDLFVTTYYNPFEQTCPATDRFLVQLNDRIADVARRHGARIVDVAPAFAGHVCDLTWMCSRFRDIHATTTGYEAIASLLAEAALGLNAAAPDRRGHAPAP